eukprot:374617_1
MYMAETANCNKQFGECQPASRIKLILNNYHKIVFDKKTKSEHKLQTEANELINNNIFNGQYSNIRLINDFYHIKYDHNTNDNSSQFHKFYKYLFDNDNALECNMNECRSAKRHYRRNRSSIASLDNNINHDIKEEYSLNIICRIHTYFIHSYETSQLTPNETADIEQKLTEFKASDEEILSEKKLELISTLIYNKKIKASQIVPLYDHSKYITANHVDIDYDKITSILNENDILIEKELVENAFTEHGYHQQNLIDDLCDILSNDTDNVKLQEIFTGILVQSIANLRED